MSRHKFASNVCEKALITADPDSRRQMIEEMMRQRQDGSSPVVTMMKDQYGSMLLCLDSISLTDLASSRLCLAKGDIGRGPGAEGRTYRADAAASCHSA